MPGARPDLVTQHDLNGAPVQEVHLVPLFTFWTLGQRHAARVLKLTMKMKK